MASNMEGLSVIEKDQLRCKLLWDYYLKNSSLLSKDPMTYWRNGNEYLERELRKELEKIVLFNDAYRLFRKTNKELYEAQETRSFWDAWVAQSEGAFKGYEEQQRKNEERFQKSSKNKK
jgi:hypothetical protein